MVDFASLALGDLERLLRSPNMGEAARATIQHRIEELRLAPRPEEGLHPGPPGVNVLPGSSTRIVKTGKRRGKMNLTETRSYKDWVVPLLAKGEVVRAEFEAVTWHIHDVAKYTPDWLLTMPEEAPYALWNVEIKTRNNIREKDKLRFLAHAKNRPWMRWTMIVWDRGQGWVTRYDFMPEVEK